MIYVTRPYDGLTLNAGHRQPLLDEQDEIKLFSNVRAAKAFLRKLGIKDFSGYEFPEYVENSVKFHGQFGTADQERAFFDSVCTAYAKMAKVCHLYAVLSADGTLAVTSHVTRDHFEEVAFSIYHWVSADRSNMRMLDGSGGFWSIVERTDLLSIPWTSPKKP